MSNILLEQILLSLVGGLAGAIIGALVGGYLSYKGTLDAAKKQIDYLNAQERENREYSDLQQLKIVRQALKVEISENLTLATNLLAAHAPALLSREAWDIYKGNINRLTPALQAALLQAYAQIIRCNSLVAFYKASARDVPLNIWMKNQADEVVKACQKVLEVIE